MMPLTRRRRVQALASIGSIGQSALRERHRIKAANASNTPDNMKSGTFFSVNQIYPGTLEAIPAITAPAPMVTNKAGSAQQSSVDVLANKDSVGASSMRREIGSTILAMCHDFAARDYVDLIACFFH